MKFLAKLSIRKILVLLICFCSLNSLYALSESEFSDAISMDNYEKVKRYIDNNNVDLNKTL